MKVDKDCPFCHAYAEFGDAHDTRCPEAMELWGDDEWASFTEAIHNGLGWADSEGMGHDHPAVEESLRRIVNIMKMTWRVRS